MSDAELEQGLTKAGVDPQVTQEIVQTNADARLAALRAAFALAALLGIVALFFTGRLPTIQPGAAQPEPEAAAAS